MLAALNLVLKTKGECPPCVQHVPGGGGGGNREEGEAGAGASGLLPVAHAAQCGPGAGFTALLRRRDAAKQPAGGQPLHCGRQPHLQRLLEQPTGPPQELPGLLPGDEQLQRGE